MSTNADTINAVLAFAQDPGISRRSTAYLLGVRAKLEFILDAKEVRAPYAEATAESDAFYAGVQNGRDYLDHWTRVGGVRP